VCINQLKDFDFSDKLEDQQSIQKKGTQETLGVCLHTQTSTPSSSCPQPHLPHPLVINTLDPLQSNSINNSIQLNQVQ
jgi:hypothetical protein